MLWLILTISAYFILAIVAVIDKFILSGPGPKPIAYSFYVGVLGISALVLIPFGFQVPNLAEIAIAFLAGGLWIIGSIPLFTALSRYEASRTIPAIGALLPLFTLGLSYLFSPKLGQEIEELGPFEIIAFVLLICGSVLITWEREKRITRKSLQLSVFAAFIFSLSFTVTKLVYLSQSFVSGLIWMRIGGFLCSLFLLFSKDLQEELFRKKKPLFKNPKLTALFLLDQGMGAGAGILQHLAIYFAPMAYLAFINALEGTRYVFLLILTTILSLKFPKILSERISKFVLLQKIFAIFLILGGLIIFSLF